MPIGLSSCDLRLDDETVKIGIIKTSKLTISLKLWRTKYLSKILRYFVPLLDHD